MYQYVANLIRIAPTITVLGSLSVIQIVLLAVLSGLALSLGFLNHDYFYCAWFGLVPLLLAIEKKSLFQSYLIGLVAGFTLFVSAAYWILDFIEISKDYGVHSGYLLAGLYWFYSAHFIALAILVFKWLSKHSNLNPFILLPMVFVVFSAYFPMLFPMRLSDTQVNFDIALQGIEYLGPYALDAIIILFNVMIYRVLVYGFSASKQTLILNRSFFVSLLIIGFWFLYGQNAYSTWQAKIQTWDTLKVGLIQVNETPKLGDSIQYSGYSQAYPPEMEMTERLTRAGAELIIWPEAQTKYYLDNLNVKYAYENNLKALNNHLLFQDMQHVLSPIDGKILKQYNTAIMIDSNGKQSDTYQKMKRIPFGEYTPVLEHNITASKWVESLFGEFTSGLSQGQTHKTFNHPKVNIIPLICYETTFPEFVANAVNNTSTTRQLNNGTMLVGLSNDGWFGSSHLPYQHIMPSKLRAIENRLPLVHLANNGPSIVVTPDGNIIFTSDFQQAAGYVVDVPYSNTAQGSFYSRHPALFINLVGYLFLLIVIYSLVNLTRDRLNSTK